MILLNYKYEDIKFFGDGEYETLYTLTVLKSYLFGLIKREEKMKYSIPMFGSIGEHESHWDELIENKTKFK